MPTNEPLIRWQRLGSRTGHEAGRQLLRQMYEEVTGQALPALSVTERGKPYIPHSPWHFSISHTKDHVFCALARCPVGIDAEEENRPIRQALAGKILSPEEFTRWRSAADPRLALLTFWVLKEARVKCSGQGLQGYPNDTCFDLCDPRVTRIDGCLVAVITENQP